MLTSPTPKSSDWVEVTCGFILNTRHSHTLLSVTCHQITVSNQ